MKKLLFSLSFAFICFFIAGAQSSDDHLKEVDEFPMFPGCEQIDGTKEDIRQCADQKLFAYLYDGLDYPAVARKNGTSGIVYISFVVESDGSISNPAIASDIGDGCGDAALQVIKRMMQKEIKFIPAKLDGKAVSFKFNLPFRFNLG